jgi:tRNA (guanine-N7-)-methyltransferase
MGRRALRRIKTGLDLSGHLHALDDLPAPLDAAGLFGRGAPLEVEVGSGKGLFLRQAAAANPAVNFIGIEIARKYATLCAARLAEDGLNNAVVVAGDALRFFRERLADRSVSAVHVYFPDPWWKKRHKKRRVINPGFLADLQRVLMPGGTFHFWTDVEEYFQSTVDDVRAATTLIGPIDVVSHEPRHDLDYRTHFERRTRLAGEPVYRAEFRKPGDGDSKQRHELLIGTEQSC